MANEHLLGVADGDSGAAVVVDLRDYEPREFKASGHIDAGRYEAEVLEASWSNKKDRQGKNLSVRFVALPSRINLRAFHAAPVGNPGDKQHDSGMQNLRDLVWSIATATGKESDVKARPLNITPAFLVGKRCFLRVDDEEYNGRTVSRVTAYITKAEFDGAPGPDATPRTFASQPSVPEVLPPSGGNSGPGPKAAIDRVLGF